MRDQPFLGYSRSIEISKTFSCSCTRACRTDEIFNSRHFFRFDSVDAVVFSVCALRFVFCSNEICLFFVCVRGVCPWCDQLMIYMTMWPRKHSNVCKDEERSSGDSRCLLSARQAQRTFQCALTKNAKDCLNLV